MTLRKLLLALLAVTCWQSAHGQSVLDSIFANSYEVYELLRLPNGMYRDAKLFSGTDYHPVSVSNTGMGLMALCIADGMNWIDDAPELALATLKTVTGHHPTFMPDRTSNGYFRHFMDVHSGQQMWNSEYSTIDTDILMSAALFATRYFQDDSIAHYTTELWNSIDFGAAVHDPVTGQLYLSMQANGNGVANALTAPYSEYMIVAWLAKNAAEQSGSPAHELWNNHYQEPSGLPQPAYGGVGVLSDQPTVFLSSFTHQFNYYLCHHFTTTDSYLDFFSNARTADAAWWDDFGDHPSEWGLGAGSGISQSYQANAIYNNPDRIVSPHIVAGFLPVHPSGQDDLVAQWNNDRGKYLLTSGHPILWRHSQNDPEWQPNEVIGIDYSTMLFGLATLPDYLGPDFFATHNDFFSSPTASTFRSYPARNIVVHPNPCTDIVRVSGPDGLSDYTIYNRYGQAVQQGVMTSNGTIQVRDLAGGLYFIRFGDGRSAKFIRE